MKRMSREIKRRTKRLQTGSVGVDGGRVPIPQMEERNSSIGIRDLIESPGIVNPIKFACVSTTGDLTRFCRFERQF
jgi:hypothetical protein